MAHIHERLRLLGLLANNEMVTSELYLAYAGTFPEHRDFWVHLAGDEVRHQGWLQGLMRQARDGDLAIQEGRFREDIIAAYHDHVQQRIREARVTPPTMAQALAIARDIESTMIERSFFMVLEGDSPALQQVLRNLHYSTESHAATIEKKWQDVTKTGSYRPR